MREAVRAILVHEGAVLLARSHDRFDPTRSWWELPGGGIEAGEELDEALRRELLEETGYVDVEIGREVCHWSTQWVFTDREIEQHDRVFAVTLRSTERVAPTPLDTEGLAEVVWVPFALIDQLRAPVVPVQLSELIASIEVGTDVMTLPVPARVPWPMINGAQVLVRLWAVPGRSDDLRLAENALLRLAGEHGGMVTARLRPLAHGTPEAPSAHDTSELPDEVHVLRFDGPLELDAYLHDPRRAEIATDAIARAEVTPVGTVPTPAG